MNDEFIHFNREPVLITQTSLAVGEKKFAVSDIESFRWAKNSPPKWLQWVLLPFVVASIYYGGVLFGALGNLAGLLLIPTIFWTLWGVLNKGRTLFLKTRAGETEVMRTDDSEMVTGVERILTEALARRSH
ncbi:MAG: DUF6232 family protein [Acidobacteriota bacterium]